MNSALMAAIYLYENHQCKYLRNKWISAPEIRKKLETRSYDKKTENHTCRRIQDGAKQTDNDDDEPEKNLVPIL